MMVLALPLAAAVDGTPATDPSTWINSNDYPESEMTRGVTGTTGFMLIVNKEGGIDDCTIMSSSGSDALDATACALLKVRARFSPGRDGTGRKRGFTYNGRVRWEIPGDVAVPIPSGTQTLTIAVDVSDKGAVESCTILERPEGLSATAPGSCLNYPEGRRVRMLTDASGKPERFRMTISQSVAFIQR